MWAPHPRGRIIRRPQPDFSHRQSCIKRRPAPQELLDSVPNPRCNYKYFGIHRSDITDHLKITVPSHAFHPSLVGEPPPLIKGRDPRYVKEKRRPETTPTSTVWFGRTCSDVSDWLRYRPPAHLGLDPDNKPLPSYPTSSSLVTDPKWQTKEFPALPNVLWHWWKERPSSVPLATNPQQVKIDTLVNALRNRVVRPSGPYTPPTSVPPTTAPTPRSGAQTPQNFIPTPNGETHQSRTQTPWTLIPTSNEEKHQSRVQTPQLQGFGDGRDPRSIEEFPIQPTAVSSSTLPSRPSSAPSGIPSNLPISTTWGKNGPIDSSPQPPSTAKHHLTGEIPRSPKPRGPCGSENSRDTPRSSNGARGMETSTLPLDVRSPHVEVQKCSCDRLSSSEVPIPRLNLQENGETSYTPPTPNKPPTQKVPGGKPPPSPKLSHPNPPHVLRKAIPRRPCGKHHAAIPSGLYVQGQGQGSNNRGVERKTPREEIARADQGLTMDGLKKLSPDSFATKTVWAEKLKMEGQGFPWTLVEKTTLKTVKVY